MIYIECILTVYKYTIIHVYSKDYEPKITLLMVPGNNHTIVSPSAFTTPGAAQPHQALLKEMRHSGVGEKAIKFREATRRDKRNLYVSLKERNIEYLWCVFDLYFGCLPKYLLEKMTKSKEINNLSYDLKPFLVMT